MHAILSLLRAWLKLADAPRSGVETGGKSIYAEFRGHVNGYADSDRQDWAAGDPAPLVFGMSWVQLAVVNNLLSSLSSAGGAAPLTPVGELGISPERVGAPRARSRPTAHDALGVVRTLLFGPCCFRSLDGTRQLFVGGRPRKLQTHGALE